MQKPQQDVQINLQPNHPTFKTNLTKIIAFDYDDDMIALISAKKLFVYDLQHNMLQFQYDFFEQPVQVYIYESKLYVITKQNSIFLINLQYQNGIQKIVCFDLLQSAVQNKLSAVNIEKDKLQRQCSSLSESTIVSQISNELLMIKISCLKPFTKQILMVINLLSFELKYIQMPHHVTHIENYGDYWILSSEKGFVFGVNSILDQFCLLHDFCKTGMVAVEYFNGVLKACFKDGTLYEQDLGLGKKLKISDLNHAKLQENNHQVNELMSLQNLQLDVKQNIYAQETTNRGRQSQISGCCLKQPFLIFCQDKYLQLKNILENRQVEWDLTALVTLPRQEKIQKFQIQFKQNKIFVIFLGILIQIPIEIAPQVQNLTGLADFIFKNNEIQQFKIISQPSVEQQQTADEMKSIILDFKNHKSRVQSGGIKPHNSISNIIIKKQEAQLQKQESTSSLSSLDQVQFNQVKQINVEEIKQGLKQQLQTFNDLQNDKKLQPKEQENLVLHKQIFLSMTPEFRVFQEIDEESYAPAKILKQQHQVRKQLTVDDNFNQIPFSDIMNEVRALSSFKSKRSRKQKVRQSKSPPQFVDTVIGHQIKNKKSEQLPRVNNSLIDMNRMRSLTSFSPIQQHEQENLTQEQNSIFKFSKIDLDIYASQLIEIQQSTDTDAQSKLNGLRKRLQSLMTSQILKPQSPKGQYYRELGQEDKTKAQNVQRLPFSQDKQRVEQINKNFKNIELQKDQQEEAKLANEQNGQNGSQMNKSKSFKSRPTSRLTNSARYKNISEESFSNEENYDNVDDEDMDENVVTAIHNTQSKQTKKQGQKQKYVIPQEQTHKTKDKIKTNEKIKIKPITKNDKIDTSNQNADQKQNISLQKVLKATENKINEEATTVHKVKKAIQKQTQFKIERKGDQQNSTNITDLTTNELQVDEVLSEEVIDEVKSDLINEEDSQISKVSQTDEKISQQQHNESNISESTKTSKPLKLKNEKKNLQLQDLIKEDKKYDLNNQRESKQDKKNGQHKKPSLQQISDKESSSTNNFNLQQPQQPTKPVFEIPKLKLNDTEPFSIQHLHFYMQNMEIHDDLTDQVNSLCTLIEKLKPSGDVMETMIQIDENIIQYHYMILMFLIYRIKPEKKLKNIYNQIMGFNIEPFMEKLLEKFQQFNDELVQTQRQMQSVTRREFKQQIFPRYDKIYTDEELQELNAQTTDMSLNETNLNSIASQFQNQKQDIKKIKKQRPGLLPISPTKQDSKQDQDKKILNTKVSPQQLENKSYSQDNLHINQENSQDMIDHSESIIEPSNNQKILPQQVKPEIKKKIVNTERENLFLKFVPLRNVFEISQQLVKANMLKKFKYCDKVWRSKTPTDQESKQTKQYIRVPFNIVKRTDKFVKFYNKNEYKKQLSLNGSKQFVQVCQNWKNQNIFCSSYLRTPQKFKNFLFEDNEEIIDVQKTKFSTITRKSQSLPFRKSYYDPEKRKQDDLVVYLQKINIFQKIPFKQTKTKDLESLNSKQILKRITKNKPLKTTLKHHVLNKFHFYNPKLTKINVSDFHFQQKMQNKINEQKCTYESASDTEMDYKVLKNKKRYDSQRYAVIQSIQALNNVNADSIQEFPLEKLQRMFDQLIATQQLPDQSLNQYQSIMHAQKVVFIESTIQSSTLLPLFINNRKEYIVDDSFKIGQQEYEAILQSEVQRMRPELAKILDTIPQPILRNEPDISEGKLKEEFLFSSEYDKLRKKEKLKFKSLRIQKHEEKKMQKDNDQKEKIMKISENQKIKQQKQQERKPLQIPVDIYQLFLLQLSLNTIVKHDHVFNYEKRLMNKNYGVIKSIQTLIPLPTLDNMIFVKAMQIFTKQFQRETQQILIMAKQQLFEEMRLKCNALKQLNNDYDNEMVLIYLSVERMMHSCKYQSNLQYIEKLSWDENNVEQVLQKRKIEEEKKLEQEEKQFEQQKIDAEIKRKEEIHKEKQDELAKITRMPMAPIDCQQLLIIWYDLHPKIRRADFDEFLKQLEFEQQMALKIKLVNQNFSVEVLRNQIKSNNQIQRFVTEDAAIYLKETKPIYRFYDLYANSIQAESNCGIAQFCKGCTSTMQFYDRGMIRIIKELDSDSPEEDRKLIKIRYSPVRDRQMKMKLRLLEQQETDIKPSQQLIDAIQSGNTEMLMSVVESHQESRLIEEPRRPVVKSQLRSRMKKQVETQFNTSFSSQQSYIKQSQQVKPLATRPISNLELECLKIPKSALKTKRMIKEVEKPTLRLVTQSVLKREKPNVNYAQMKYEEELHRSDVNLVLMIKK